MNSIVVLSVAILTVAPADMLDPNLAQGPLLTSTSTDAVVRGIESNRSLNGHYPFGARTSPNSSPRQRTNDDPTRSSGPNTTSADPNGYVRAKGTQLNSRLSAAASAADAAASDLAARIAGRNDDEDQDEKNSTPAAPQGTRIVEAQWTDEPERTSIYANDRRGAELLGGTGYPRTKTALYEHFSIEEVDEGEAEAPMMPMQVGHG